jgi:hypothetical protein
MSAFSVQISRFSPGTSRCRENDLIEATIIIFSSLPELIEKEESQIVYTQMHARTQKTQPHVPRHAQAHTINKQTRDIKRDATIFDFLIFNFLRF